MSKEKAITSKQKECFLDGHARRPHSRTRQAPCPEMRGHGASFCPYTNPNGRATYMYVGTRASVPYTKYL